jgi:hypothetical protein
LKKYFEKKNLEIGVNKKTYRELLSLISFNSFKIKNKGQRTKDKGQRTKDKGQRTKDKGQKTKDKR